MSNSELLAFLKEHVPTKEDLRRDLNASEKRIVNQIEKLSTKMNQILNQDYPFQKKRISRVLS